MLITLFHYDRINESDKDKVDLLEQIYIVSVRDLIEVEGLNLFPI